jgi:beta-glucanase (GH16 family)
MATLDNRLRAINFQVQSFLGLEKQDNNENFELVKEWDFTRLDFDSLKKDFRFIPPWGEKVNKVASCKYNESNIKLSSEGIEFWNSVNTGSDNEETPYIAGAIVTRKATTLPAFGKIEALVEIPRYKGQWPAFWTTDEVAAMPEFDVFEFIWPSWKEEATMAGNVHYGTAYNSEKWKFDNPSWLGISGKTWDKPIKFSAEFYPHETLYKVNNYVVYKTTQGYSPNNKVVWLNGGTYNRGGGPIGEGPWLSLKAKYLKFYRLKE